MTAHCYPPSITASSPSTASAIAISAPSSFPRPPTTKTSFAVAPLGSAASCASAGSRPNHQNHRHAPLSANFHRSQDYRCYPQRPTLHRRPTHTRDSSANSRSGINTMKNLCKPRTFCRLVIQQTISLPMRSRIWTSTFQTARKLRQTSHRFSSTRERCSRIYGAPAGQLPPISPDGFPFGHAPESWSGARRAPS